MRISIDPNVRVANNETYAGFEDLFGDIDILNEGDYLLAMVDNDDVVLDSTRIDRDKRLIYLAVKWQSARRDTPTPAWSVT